MADDDRIEKLEFDLEQAIGDVSTLETRVAELQARLEAVCAELGHAVRVTGDWPEDSVCPRCGDVEVSVGFTVDVVPPLEPPDDDFTYSIDGRDHDSPDGRGKPG